jgi:protein phosphatase
VVRLRPPAKIFGSLHGNFLDLMRFFDQWKTPTDFSTGGDIDQFDYVFLGNYVDRGAFNLETICLLMALKIKFPDQIHLLRGNHEDRKVNINYGLGEECKLRLEDDLTSADSVFKKLNEFFDYLPLAAIIGKKICCMHGGIGSNATRIEDIEAIKRPIDLSSEVTT